MTLPLENDKIAPDFSPLFPGLVSPSPRQALDQRHIVALEQDLACHGVSLVRQTMFASMSHAPSGRLVSLSLVLVICLTSTASSITRFMNSSKPCKTVLCQQARTESHVQRRHTLILPSMRIASCS